MFTARYEMKRIFQVNVNLNFGFSHISSIPPIIRNLYNGYRGFPRGTVRPGRAADHSPPSSATVMEE